jgi:hypothetical protein
VKAFSESRMEDSSDAEDWATTFWLITDPRIPQVARKAVAEKSARRERGAIKVVNLEIQKSVTNKSVTP